MSRRETQATECRKVEVGLPARCYFVLSSEKFEQFVAILDEPPKENPKLRRLLETKAPWERG